MLARLGLPLDERGRVRVDETLRVEGADDVWALGDCARVPNLAAPEPDPPTSQHALRQARRLAKNLRGTPQPYRYRMLGQVATLGRYKGIADVLGVRLCGFPGWFVDPHVPPAPAAAHLAEAPRRRGLDDLALLPPRHRRARQARPPAGPAGCMRRSSSCTARGGAGWPNRAVRVRERTFSRRAADRLGFQLPPRRARRARRRRAGRRRRTS